jgi:hypothetical protein
MTTILLFKNNASLVDQLGRLQAQIADLEAKEKALKAALVAAGVGAYEGELFRATVSASERSTLDMAAVREKLSPQFLRAHTKVTPVNTVRVSAKKDGINASLPA